MCSSGAVDLSCTSEHIRGKDVCAERVARLQVLLLQKSLIEIGALEGSHKVAGVKGSPVVCQLI